MSDKQKAVVDFVRNNPGCIRADVARWEGYMGAPRRGHWASYARVNRLIQRSIISSKNDKLFVDSSL